MINLILVRQREEIHQNMDEQEVETEVELPETKNDVNETGIIEEVVKNLPEISLDENDKELEQYFLHSLTKLISVRYSIWNQGINLRK